MLTLRPLLVTSTLTHLVAKAICGDVLGTHVFGHIHMDPDMRGGRGREATGVSVAAAFEEELGALSLLLGTSHPSPIP